MYKLHILLIFLLTINIGQFKRISNESFVSKNYKNVSASVNQKLNQLDDIHRDSNSVNSTKARNFRSSEGIVFKNDLYTNYKEIYGIRYSPLPDGKHLPTITAMDSLLNQEDDTYIENNEINSDDKTTVVDTNVHQSAEDDTLKHIMRPSSFRRTLDFIKDRLKNLFIRSFLENSEEARIMQDLKSSARFLNIFNIIKFDNIPCATNRKPLMELNGVCYLESECKNLGGIAVDKCAGNFGVCCVCELCPKMKFSSA